MPDFDALAAGLRAWAEGDRIAEAATELLIAHETWLRRGDGVVYRRPGVQAEDGRIICVIGGLVMVRCARGIEAVCPDDLELLTGKPKNAATAAGRNEIGD